MERLGCLSFAKGRDLFVSCAAFLVGFPHINGLLQVEPEFRRGLEDAGQAVREVGGDGAAFTEQFADHTRRDAQALGQFGLRKSGGRQDFRAQDFAGMRRAARAII